MFQKKEIVLTFIGSGGDGVISMGGLLLSAAAKQGLFGFLLKSFGPQIRGGETSAKLRISGDKIHTQGDTVDIMVVFSWQDYLRFQSEYDFTPGGYIFSDSDDPLDPQKQPVPWDQLNLKNITLPIAQIAKEKIGQRRGKNIFMLGVISNLFNLPVDGLKTIIQDRFIHKGREIVAANLNALDAGVQYSIDIDFIPEFKFDFKPGTPKMLLTGNDAISLGALRQGLNLYASYPITPASEILEFMSVHLPKLGGAIIQAEDEIAAINMAIGGSFAGKKTMTGSSGPGIALKSEAIGLASIAEIPLVIVNVQRGGPSTGIPTKSEQSDLMQALFLTHGDAPKVVIAPTNVADNYDATNYAFQISELFQLPVIILSDQFIGQRLESLDPFPLDRFEKIDRIKPEEYQENYQRYALTDNGISPMAIPGQKGVIYQTNGLEHLPSGRPTSDFDIHQKMSEKRQRKIETIKEKYNHLIYPKGVQKASCGVITWGSSRGVVEEAVDLLLAEGYKISCATPMLIAPLPITALKQFIAPLKRLVVVEQSFSAQFCRYLRSEIDLPKDLISHARPGGRALTVHEIYQLLKKQLETSNGN